ncbi:CshA-type fibril repeat protein, partial [Acinetobacter calcoaceticus]
MSVKNIVLKINDKKATLDTFSIEGGKGGRGAQGTPLKLAAKANVHYELTDLETQFGPENIATKRAGKDLWISFEGGDIEQPDLIIEGYYADNAQLGYADGESNLIIGQHENGKYYPYVPESADKNDAVSLLADQAEAGQALGGEEVAAFWAFNPWWLLALLPVAALAIDHDKDKGGNKFVPPVVTKDYPPVAGDDSGKTKPGQPVEIEVISNDTDKDGTIDPKTVVITKQPANGTVAVDPITGKVTYTPNPGFSGPDEFEYTVKDNHGNPSNPAKVVIDVETPPVAVDDKANTKVDQSVVIDITANDSDLEDGKIDPKTVEITKQPANGTVTVDADGKVTYTPNPGYAGADEFEYIVKDSDGNESDPAKVVIDVEAKPVEPILVPPVATNDSGTTQENTPVEIDIIANDTDADGTIDATTVVITKQPANGTLEIDPTTGKVTYTPNEGFSGADEFEYTVKDNDGQPSNPAKVVIDVEAKPVEPILVPPVATNDSGTTQENTPVEIDIIANDTDVDGTIDPTTVEITKQPANGTLEIDPTTGKVTYTPNEGFSGADEFEYTVKDNDGQPSNPAKVVIDVEAKPVEPILVPPVATNDSGTTQENTPVEIDIIANDTDADGTIDATTVVITKQPANGTLEIDPTTGKVTYTPNEGFSGADEFEYTVKDNDGQPSNPAKVVIDVEAKPVEPILVPPVAT